MLTTEIENSYHISNGSAGIIDRQAYFHSVTEASENYIWSFGFWKYLCLNAALFGNDYMLKHNEGVSL